MAADMRVIYAALRQSDIRHAGFSQGNQALLV